MQSVPGGEVPAQFSIHINTCITWVLFAYLKPFGLHFVKIQWCSGTEINPIFHWNNFSTIELVDLVQIFESSCQLLNHPAFLFTWLQDVVIFFDGGGSFANVWH